MATLTETPVQQALKMNPRRRLPRIPRIRVPLGIERQYQTKLRAFVRGIGDAIDRIMLADLDNLLQQAAALRPVVLDQFDPAEAVSELAESTRINLSGPATNAQIQALAETAGIATSDFNRRQLLSLFKTMLGVDLFLAEPFLVQELQTFTAANVALIKNVQSEFIAGAERVIFDGFRRGVRSSVIRAQILGLTKGNKAFAPTQAKALNRANLIARDQVSKLNGNLNELRQQSVGIEEFTWRDSADGRVRDDHQLDGEIFRWNRSISRNGRSKPKSGLNPSEDIQCRCWAEPFFEDLLEDLI